MSSDLRTPHDDEIANRVEWAVNEAHKMYWVGDNFNGRDEFICSQELSFNEFRDRCADRYDKRHWNDDTKKINREWLVFLMQDRIDGINRYRGRLGRFIDQRMQQIITREADATKDSRNPRKLNDFISARIPSVNFVANRYNITQAQAVEQIKDKVLGSRLTVREWYDQYRQLHRHAYVSEETVKELALPQYANRPGYGKPDKRPIKPNKKPKSHPLPDDHPTHPLNKKVHDDVIAYPFKSKLERYRKDHPDEDVQFIETPTQTRINYQNGQRPYFSNTRGAWEIDHCFNMAQPGDKWMCRRRW